MPFDATRFVVSRSLIEREGVSQSDATRLAIVPSIVQMPLVQSVVLAQAIGRREAPTETPAPSPTGTPQGQTLVPKVVGETYADAVEQLKLARLQVEPEIAPESANTLEVSAQKPEEGVDAADGDRVTVTLSSPKAEVPGVTDQTYFEALVELADKGLCGVPHEPEPVPESNWTVNEQEPSKGKEVLRGTTVTLTLVPDDEQGGPR
ncbi:PASTA domain-containing protein [Demequina rhizosphaerae]|uniref:PASTA domain-containing protein n=1 Tax=Demequina rhizosphaerae TaxID=1638985 RepID=UPI0009E20F34|nr:PASTA domain-containing protein [Demequina rhizosphaerae]